MEPNNTYHRPKTESIFEVYVTPKDELSKGEPSILLHLLICSKRLAEYGEAHSVKHKITSKFFPLIQYKPHKKRKQGPSKWSRRSFSMDYPKQIEPTISYEH